MGGHANIFDSFQSDNDILSDEDCGLLGCYAVWLLLRIDDSEERITSIITMKDSTS
jgi:hypothetical protein